VFDCNPCCVFVLVGANDIGDLVREGEPSIDDIMTGYRAVLNEIRRRLPEARVALHTNGQLAEKKMAVLNQYDRATISLPSFDPETFAQMCGTQRMPNLERILSNARIPIKVSCVVDTPNAHQIGEFIAQCHGFGVRRLALRQLYGDGRTWEILPGLEPTRYYRSNAVYDFRGMEVTYWNFDDTSSTSLNLFSDGTISGDYLLTRANSTKNRKIAIKNYLVKFASTVSESLSF